MLIEWAEEVTATETAITLGTITMCIGLEKVANEHLSTGLQQQWTLLEDLRQRDVLEALAE